MVKNKKPNVAFVRGELTNAMRKYTIIQDALEGQEAVKYRKEKYLPVPSSMWKGGTATKEYDAYITRAVYYNATLPTCVALVGQLFLRSPIVELPTELTPMIEDINSEGLTLEALVRKAANFVLPFGRGGFLSDFPETNGEVTKQQLDDGEIKPIIRFFEPWAIINWKVEKVVNVMRTTLLVLKEMIEYTRLDDFTIEIKPQYRVFRLLNGECNFYLYDDTEKLIKSGKITDGKGKSLTYIPFEFIGSENNDTEIDEPPFYNLAILNIAHYRNSADYEESCFLTGQPTPVYTGLTQEWVDMNFKDGVPFGSRASVPLPADSDAKLLQANPNTLVFEAMQQKEQQMIAIGAKILRAQGSVERKQAEIEIEAASQRSVLQTIRDNIQLALVNAMKTCASFVNATGEIKIELNDNFDLTSMAPEQLRYVLESYDADAITFSEMRETLRRGGMAKLTDDEARKQLVEDRKFKDELVPALEKEAAKAKNDAMNKPQPVGKA